MAESVGMVLKAKGLQRQQNDTLQLSSKDSGRLATDKSEANLPSIASNLKWNPVGQLEVYRFPKSELLERFYLLKFSFGNSIYKI